MPDDGVIPEARVIAKRMLEAAHLAPDNHARLDRAVAEIAPFIRAARPDAASEEGERLREALVLVQKLVNLPVEQILDDTERARRVKLVVDTALAVAHPEADRAPKRYDETRERTKSCAYCSRPVLASADAVPFPGLTLGADGTPDLVQPEVDRAPEDER